MKSVVVKCKFCGQSLTWFCTNEIEAVGAFGVLVHLYYAHLKYKHPNKNGHQIGVDGIHVEGEFSKATPKILEGIAKDIGRHKEAHGL